MSDTPDLETVFKLLEDNYARTILTATSIEAMSAKELAEECDSSLPTVYRRVEDLEDANLIKEETRLRKDGHHETVYVAVLDEFSVRLREGELKYEIKHRKEDKADRLKRMWEEL